MLAGKGYENVINVSGGIREWNGGVALGDVELGLSLFSGEETPAEALMAAYALEEGLREFYLSMEKRVKSPEVRDLFRKLSGIEVKHQDRIFAEYCKLEGEAVDREAFVEAAAAGSMEGGMTTDEYVALFKPDWESPTDVISLAMSIEAQALDLYKRAADRSEDPRGGKVLSAIADEEMTHLSLLAELLETLQTN